MERFQLHAAEIRGVQKMEDWKSHEAPPMTSKAAVSKQSTCMYWGVRFGNSHCFSDAGDDFGKGRRESHNAMSPKGLPAMC